jgi:hypothetical protein
VKYQLPLEETQLILDKYEELNIPFFAMKDIGKDILKEASFEVTIMVYRWRLMYRATPSYSRASFFWQTPVTPS